MGRHGLTGELGRALVALGTFSLVVFVVALQPATRAGAAQPTPAAERPQAVRAGHSELSLFEPADLPIPWSDAAAKLSIVPPPGWTVAPRGSLNPPSDPTDQAFEVVRFQQRVGDGGLYAQPVPVTSGLLADAGAVLSIALARDGTELADLELDRAEHEDLTVRGGLVGVDEETVYEGVLTYTRYLVSRASGRVLVARAYLPEPERGALLPTMRASIAALRAEPDGPNGPAPVVVAPPQPPPAPEPAPATPGDPSASRRAEILARAALMLGTPYRWGGSLPGRGMDCSAYVSAAWDVARYTTDSIWSVARSIAKEDLLPGDALNLETWRDPTRRGHIRLFAAWANAAHTLVWVYEETPPRAVHRVIAYDERYRPMRLAGLSGDGEAPLVVAPAPPPTFAPVFRPTTVKATPRPTVKLAPRPTVKPTSKVTPKPTSKTTVKATPRPTVKPTSTPSSSTKAARTPSLRTADPTLAAPTKTPVPTASPSHR